MNSNHDHRREILRMRADADRLAAAGSQHARGPHPLQIAHTKVLLRDSATTKKIRLRRLQLGERLLNGDLWLDAATGTLHALPRRWYRAFAGRVGPESVEHYRVE